MSKRDRTHDPRDSRANPPPNPSPVPPGILAILTLAGVGVLIFINLKIWNQTERFQSALERLDQIDARVAQVGSKVDNYAKAAAPARQGPDPNKVYQVKTGGAPTEGPDGAPVTIAEFSDFQ